MNVLEKIVADKKLELIERKANKPLSSFEHELSPSQRDFKQALINDNKQFGAAYILEIKKASPSKGLIRADFNLEEICQSYKQYASCVSVLTDEKYFQGQFERLPLVANKLHQPLLCKDFFIDEYQVYLARAFGADAILLMLSVLTDSEYENLSCLASQLNMDVLTEVSNTEEMERAIKLKANILGINNRNLRDLSTDLNKTPELVALFNELTDEIQKQQTVLISESGIYDHQQTKLLSKHVSGFLVGSSLMTEQNLEKACSNLIHGQHKICGLSSLEQAKWAIESGANYLGLIFVDKSPRAVSFSRALDIVNTYPQGQFVAVVQNKSHDEVVDLAKKLRLFAVQLHGNESNEYIDQLSAAFKAKNINTEIWQAISVMDTISQPNKNANKAVLDTKLANGQSGGTGKTFDWQLLNKIDLNWPPTLVAGGINISNINDAITTPVLGLDINSGVESTPGQKSKQKIESLFNLINTRNNHD